MPVETLPAISAAPNVERCVPCHPNASRLIQELEYPLRQYAEWRRMKAIDHPYDDRNANAARMADAIADTLNDIPSDTLSKLEPHVQWEDGDHCPAYEAACEDIRTLGFHWRSGSAADFIQFLIPD